ncbi:MAG: hypothetical protein ACPL4H_11035, partial [Anaerolineales bacterium]
VLSGWIIGFVFVWIFIFLEKPVVAWFQRQQHSTQYGSLFLLSLLLIGIGYILKSAFAFWKLPAEWVNLALASAPSATIFEPFSLAGLITSAAAFFGMTSGAIWIKAQGDFSKAENFRQGLARFAIGLIGVLILWAGLDLVFPAGESLIAGFFRYLRYALVGFWIGGFSPWLFIKFKLAHPR